MSDKTQITVNEQSQFLINEIISVWNNGFMGIDIGRLIIATVIFAAFLILRGVFSRYILNAVHRWTEKSETDIDDKIIDSLMPPIRFIPIVLGLFFASQYLQLDGTLADFVGRFIRSLIAFTIFWAIHRSLDPIQHLSKKLERMLTPMMMNWIFKVLKVVIVFIGAAVILELWGIAIGPLLAGLGLFGAAVALGAQDLFKNLIGGMTVIAEKRFHPGDWIKVDGVVEGTVEEIGFRSTRIRRFDKAPVYVPNANLSDTVVTNFSRMTNRRIFWHVGVEYRTTKEQLQIVRDEITKYLQESKDIAQPPSVPQFVRLDNFGASSIDFMIYCFTKTTDWGEFLRVKEEFALAVKEIVEEKAGTGFAFPSQSIYLESIPDDAAEVFTPPPEEKSKEKPKPKAKKES